MLPDTSKDRKNRRGCFVIAAVAALAIAALAYIGLSSDSPAESNQDSPAARAPSDPL